jgi:cysteine synthase
MRMKVVSDISELIGETPLLELKHLFKGKKANIFAKLELFNPMSIKDRPVLNMIKEGIKEGKINSNIEVVEASSGNTAIAIALLGVILDYKVRIYISELASVERRQILCAYGAKVIVTPGIEHTKGARRRAMGYCQAHPDSTFFLNQHGNPNNGRGHEKTTGPEIWEQLEGNIDAMVIGLGTSGTFDGVSRYMKNKNPNIKIIAFEPYSSPVYSGGKQGKHKLIGIGPGFITDNFKRSQHNLDELILVTNEEAFEWVRKIALTEGLLVGPTSGAAACVCNELSERPEFEGKNIACIFYDSGERYLTVPNLFPGDKVEFSN